MHHAPPCFQTFQLELPNRASPPKKRCQLFPGSNKFQFDLPSDELLPFKFHSGSSWCCTRTTTIFITISWQLFPIIRVWTIPKTAHWFNALLLNVIVSHFHAPIYHDQDGSFFSCNVFSLLLLCYLFVGFMSVRFLFAYRLCLLRAACSDVTAFKTPLSVVSNRLFQLN